MAIKFTKEITGDVAVLRAEDENLFAERAKEEGIDKKTIKMVDDFRAKYAEFVVGEAANAATEVLKENADVKKVEVIAPFGAIKSDVLDTVVYRERTVRDPQTGEERKVAAIKVQAKIKAAKVSKKYIRELRDNIMEQLAGK